MRTIVRRVVATVTVTTALLHGQPQNESAAAASRATIDRLVATIQDDSKRQQLVEELQALIAVEPRPASAPARQGLFETVTGVLAGISGEVRAAALLVIEQASLVPMRLRGLWQALQDPAQRAVLLGEAVRLGSVLLAAVAAFLATVWLVRRFRQRLTAPTARAPGRLVLAGRITSRALFDVAPAAAAVVAGLLVATVVHLGPEVRIVAVAALTALALRRLASVAIDVLLSPGVPSLRPVPLCDERADALGRHLHRLASVAILGWLVVAVADALGPPELTAAIREVYGLALLGTAIALVLANRRSVRAWLQERRAGATSPGTLSSLLWSLASLWWLLAIAYFVALYVVWSRDAAGASRFLVRASLASVGIVVGAALVLGLVRMVTRWGEERARAWTGAVPELRDRVPSYARLARLALDAMALGLAVCLLLEAWGVGGLAGLRSDAARTLLSAALDVLLIVVIAMAAIDAATVFAQRFVDERMRTGRATAKVRTLVPLARTAIKVVVLTGAGIMVLAAIGIDVGPLLAGVGILGLAVGFGAQTLVKDVITGVFILMEDTMSVGDICSFAGVGGVVEAIGLRSVRLRDLQGVVHTVPFSSVDKVSNMTKEYSCWLVEAGVGYGEDVDRVTAELRRLGEELRDDPQFGPDILEPIEIIGLDRFADSAVVIRARFKTRVAAQWRVGREFNRRMKQAFDAAGIEIPFPHRTVFLRREDTEAVSPPAPSPGPS
ncbi:MAG: mechanosensitive ion channel [Planctomycetota bacterium]